MLKTMFVFGFVAVPLVLAFMLILYRARYFLLGIAAIALLLVLLWGGLRIAALWDPGSPDISAAIHIHGQMNAYRKAISEAEQR